MLSALRRNIEKNLHLKFKKSFEENLRDRGLSLRPTDLAAFVEGIAPKSSRVVLSYALDLLRPFSAGMGFRVTRLSDRQIELLIPLRTRNRDDEGRIHEGALLTAALETARLLWLRHAPLGEFHVNLKDCYFHFLQEYSGDLRVRMELPEMQCESVMAEIRRHRHAETDVTLTFFDDKEKTVAESTLTLSLKHIPSLAAP